MFGLAQALSHVRIVSHAFLLDLEIEPGPHFIEGDGVFIVIDPVYSPRK